MISLLPSNSLNRLFVKKKFFAFSLLFLLTIQSIGQITKFTGENGSKTVTENSVVWLAWLSRARVSDKFSVHLDASYRTIDFMEHTFQWVGRVGAIYHLPKDVTLSGGISAFWHYQYPSNAEPYHRFEYRPWEEIMIPQEMGKLELNHRFRFEQRFNKNVVNNEVQDDFVYNLRSRYRIQAQYPLGKKSIRTPGSIFIYFSEEIFINSGINIVYNFFDQNRISLGLGHRFSKSLQLQAGYMNIYSQRTSGNRFEEIHTLVIGLQTQFDLRKPKK